MTDDELMAPGTTKRSQVRRLPEKASHDRALLNSILDEALYATVAVVGADNQPFAVPCAHIRDGNDLLIHGSRASRLFKIAASGAPICATVTLFDGLVYARSLFESSMQYRSAMVLGSATRVDDDDLAAALITLSRKLLPGHVEHARWPNDDELRQTMVLRLPLAEASVKVGAGPADDDLDVDRQAWSGWIPIVTVGQTPVPSPTLPPGVEVPQYVLDNPLLTGDAL